MASHMTWHGAARYGTARYGMAQHMTWHSMAQYGTGWHGTAWHGKAWHGLAGCSMAWQGMVWHGKAWYGMTWHSMASLCKSPRPKPAGLGELYHLRCPQPSSPHAVGAVSAGPLGRAYCNLPAPLPWGHDSSGGTRSCSGSEPPKQSPHTPETRGSPAAVPPAPPRPAVPRRGTPAPRPPGTALPSPAKQVLPFIFGWRRGCKRSPAGAQPHCKPVQPHCKPLRCPLRAECRQTTLVPCAYASAADGVWVPRPPRGEGLGRPHSPCVV